MPSPPPSHWMKPTRKGTTPMSWLKTSLRRKLNQDSRDRREQRFRPAARGVEQLEARQLLSLTDGATAITRLAGQTDLLKIAPNGALMGAWSNTSVDSGSF